MGPWDKPSLKTIGLLAATNLQNAKDQRTCRHKSVYIEAWIMTDENDLEFKICKSCYYRYRNFAGYIFKPCPRHQEPEIRMVQPITVKS